MPFQPIKWANPFDGLIDPIWVPGNGGSGGSTGGNPLNQLFSFKGVALAGIVVYGLVELKGGEN